MKTYEPGYEEEKSKQRLSKKEDKHDDSDILRFIETTGQEKISRMMQDSANQFSQPQSDATGRAIFRSAFPNAFVQMKLEISQPGDAHEEQADKVADAVVKGDTKQSQSALDEKPAPIQAKSEGGTLTTTPGFDSQLQSTKGSGSKMDASTKGELEQHTGTDLSGVNIHTGNDAHTMSESINAKAFTHGQDIYFKNGNYNPGTPEGKSLLAHEVAHTVQQGSGVERQSDAELDYEDPFSFNPPVTAPEQIQSYTVSNPFGDGINVYEKADFSLPKTIENNTNVIIHWKGIVIVENQNALFEIDTEEDRVQMTGTDDLIFEKVLIEIVEPIDGSSYKAGDKVEGFIYNPDRWNKLQFLLDPAEVYDFPSSRYRKIKAIVAEHDNSFWGGFFADFPDTKTKYLMRFFTEEDKRLFEADTELYDRVKELLSTDDWKYGIALWEKTPEENLPPEVSQKDLKRTEELQKYAEAYKAFQQYENLGIFNSSSSKAYAKNKLIAELEKLNEDRYKGEDAIENFEKDMGGVKEERLAFFRDMAIKEANFLMDISEKVLIGETPTYLEGIVQSIKDDLKKEAPKFEELSDLDTKYAGGVSDVTMRWSYTTERNDKLYEIRQDLAQKNPILLDENIDLEQLYQDYAVKDESNLQLQELLEDTIIDRHKDIDATRKNLESDPDLVWEFDNLISLTKAQLNLGDEMLDAMVDEKAKSVQHTKMLIQAGLGAIGIGLTIVSFGELSPAAMALVADVGIGLAAIDAYMIYTDTRIKKAASNIAHDKALVLTQEDPSYWWLALPIVSMGFDMLSSLRMLKALKGAESLAEKEADELIETTVNNSKLPENTTSEEAIGKIKQTFAQRREATENIKLLAEAQGKSKSERALELAKDPKKAKPDLYEGEVGAEAEQAYGYFKRDPSGDADFKSISGDYEGKTFDALGAPASIAQTPKFKLPEFIESLEHHLNKQVDYLLVDVRYMSQSNRQSILDFLIVHHPNQMDRVIFIGIK